MSTVINENELLELTGFKYRGHLEKCLRKQNIKYYYGQGGRIWTTLEALNCALGLPVAKSQSSREWDFS